MIIVKPNGGLGNRMRVIHSAMLLARMHNQRSITVLWKKDSGLNAGFFELFESIPGVSIEQNLAMMAIKFYGTKRLPAFKFVDDNLSLSHQYDLKYWQNISKNFLINSCIDFLSHEDSENLYSLFRPVSKIQQKIDQLKREFSENTVGVQIRRQDNNPSILNSPVEGFIRKMNKALKENPAITFFLCTDDSACERELKNLFGDKVITQGNKEFSRNSLLGIESAMVDMYALSETKYILGSYQSSFGEVASYIGEIPFFVVN